MGVINAVALAAAAALWVAPFVHAHGWLQRPLSRQFCNGNEIMWSVGIAGGNGARGSLTAYGGVPGMCGDPFKGNPDKPLPNFETLPCDPQEIYEEEGIMSMQVDISTNHGGFWEISVCDRKEISQDCFDKWKLRTVEHDSEQWYIRTKTIENPDPKRPEIYTMDWKLPEGLTCKHCVVQWTWWTQHNCVYPCEKEVCGFYADRKNEMTRPNSDWDMKWCETKWPAKGQQPQMFRNCADIMITPKGGAAAAKVPTDAEQPAKKPAEEPAERPAEQPAEGPAERPANEPGEQPPEEPAEAPAPEQQDPSSISSPRQDSLSKQTAEPAPAPTDLEFPPALPPPTHPPLLEPTHPVEEQPFVPPTNEHPIVPSTQEQPVLEPVSVPNEPLFVPEPVQKPVFEPPSTPMEHPPPPLAPMEHPPAPMPTPPMPSPTEHMPVPTEHFTPPPQSEDSWYNHPFFHFVSQYGWRHPGDGAAPPSPTTTPPTPPPPLVPENSAPLMQEAAPSTPPPAPFTPPHTPAPVSPPPPTPQQVFTEQDSCTMSHRRFLLGEEVLEEEDSTYDFSGAGGAMNCDDFKVDEVLIEINKMRKEVKAQPLECSNRAVGVCENFADIMADLGRELHTKVDNCNLSNFGGRCSQMVAIGAIETSLLSIPSIDFEPEGHTDHMMQELVNPTYVVAGVGYYDLGGIRYWCLLLG